MSSAETGIGAPAPQLERVAAASLGQTVIPSAIDDVNLTRWCNPEAAKPGLGEIRALASPFRMKNGPLGDDPLV